MNETPTKTLTTKAGHKVVIKEWITGREKREITKIFLYDLEKEKKEGDQESSNIKMSIAEETEKKAIETLVISVNGSTENILNNLLDLPAQDYEEVNSVISEIVYPKKKSESTS